MWVALRSVRLSNSHNLYVMYVFRRNPRMIGNQVNIKFVGFSQKFVQSHVMAVLAFFVS